MSNTIKIYGLSLLGGLLLYLSWPTMPLTFLVFVAFVPLLLIEDIISKSDSKYKAELFFGATYLFLFTWNITTTWWIWNASPAGAVLAIILNSLLMSIPLVLFRKTKLWIGNKLGYLSFALYYVAFEYLHLNWELSWPWLTLGNVFAMHPDWVQWYEYTGALGGSFWILILNLSLFFVLKRVEEKKFKFTYAIPTFLIFVLSFLISFGVKLNNRILQRAVPEPNIIVVQPNIDPYTEKYPEFPDFVPFQEQFNRLLELSEEKITPKTEMVAWPETSMPFGFWEDEIEQHPIVRQLKEWTKKHNVTLIAGIDSYKAYPLDKAPAIARPYEDYAYVAYNSAIRISGSDSVQIYHKSQLVPGVEQLPYPELLSFVEKYAIDLGGTTGTLGRQKERAVFEGGTIKGAPVICYESIFGEFVSDYVKLGANVIVIVTNDAWWGETEGHRQHFHYARLRAIETRMWVARAANTGISGFINPKGEITQQSKYREKGSYSAFVAPNNNKTFYTEYGDNIVKVMVFLSMALFLSAFVKKKAKL